MIYLNNKLFEFIENSPTAFHAVNNVRTTLVNKGFCELVEGKSWVIEPGKNYFVSRNGSSLIAFKIPAAKTNGMMIASVHSDSPCFKLKDNCVINENGYIRLSAERYGGLINSTWMDRPLSVAGRIVVKSDNGILTRLVDFKHPVAMIPHVAIHLNRKVNDSLTLNPAVDLVPLYALSDSESNIFDAISKLTDVSVNDILSYDLYLYNTDKGVAWNDFISAPRLDDLQCVFAALTAFISSENTNAIPVLAIFDNEEVGSSTKQGADSDFFNNVVNKLFKAIDTEASDVYDLLANSFMLSCDNGHAVHPNHPELTDKNDSVRMNGGVVLKFNANQSYCTDGISGALVKTLCEKAGVPCQSYSNRSDITGGSTLGNIANTHTSLVTADVGLAQLAMHSAMETAGNKDTEYMVDFLNEFFTSSIKHESDGVYTLN